MLKSTSIDIAKFRFRIARATVNECERNAELTAKVMLICSTLEEYMSNKYYKGYSIDYHVFMLYS